MYIDSLRWWVYFASNHQLYSYILIRVCLLFLTSDSGSVNDQSDSRFAFIIDTERANDARLLPRWIYTYRCVRVYIYIYVYRDIDCIAIVLNGKKKSFWLEYIFRGVRSVLKNSWFICDRYRFCYKGATIQYFSGLTHRFPYCEYPYPAAWKQSYLRRKLTRKRKRERIVKFIRCGADASYSIIYTIRIKFWKGNIEHREAISRWINGYVSVITPVRLVCTFRRGDQLRKFPLRKLSVWRAQEPALFRRLRLYCAVENFDSNCICPSWLNKRIFVIVSSLLCFIPAAYVSSILLNSRSFTRDSSEKYIEINRKFKALLHNAYFVVIKEPIRSDRFNEYEHLNTNWPSNVKS